MTEHSVTENGKQGQILGQKSYIGSIRTITPAVADRLVWRRLWSLVPLLLSILLVDIAQTQAQTQSTAEKAEEYRLGIQDRLDIRIGRWRSTDGVYENWEGVGGEHVVGPDGRVFVAVAGSVRAARRTLAELAGEISHRVQRRIGMDRAPAIAIQVIEYRPIYVVGAVNTPGEHRYRPELTVLQAIGLAGGHLRATDTAARPQRELIIEARDFEVLRQRKWRLIARLARLDSEIEGKERIEPPNELAEVANADKLLSVEAAILTTHLNAAISKNESIDQLSELLTATIKSLDEEFKLRNQQLEIAKAELVKVQALVKKGLTVSAREATARAAITELEATLLDLKVTKLNSEQKLNEAAREKLDLASERRRLIVTESQTLREELDQIVVKLQAARSLVTQAAALGGQTTQLENGEPPTYRLSRRVDGQTSTRDVEIHETLKPGDTLQVIAPNPLPRVN